MSAYSPSLLLLLALAACTAANKDETASDPSSATTTTTATTTAGSDTATTGQPGSVSQTDPDPTTDPTTESPTGSDSSGPPTSDTNTTSDTSDPGTTTGAPAVSFTDVFEQVIMPNGCNAGYCHGGGAGGLEMTDEATSYANLVEVGAVATLCDQSTRVVPGSPDESVMWIRARPSAMDAMTPCAEGSKMPKPSMGLADPQAQLLRDWILGGALE